MSKAPSFQWYPKDCDTDENVRSMTDEEFGFYMRCLNHAWLNSGLPEDFEKLAKLFPRDRRVLRRLWKTVEPLFVLVDGRYVHPKLEAQRLSVRHYIESKRHAAEVRWSKQKDQDEVQSTCNAHASDVQCPASASPPASPSPENLNTCAAETAARETALFPIGEVKNKAWYDREHARWYKSFWNRVAKAASRKAFEKRVRILVAGGMTHEQAVAFLHEALLDYRVRFEPTESWNWRQNMHPATWLNGARWEDEVLVTANSRASPKESREAVLNRIFGGDDGDPKVPATRD